MLDVGRSLVSELDLETVLAQVLETARDLTGARYAALGVLDEGRQELERFIALGIDDETRAAIGSLPRGRGVLGELIRNPRPLRLADVSTHPRSFGFPPGHPRMRTFLGAPIMIGDEVWGNLYLAEKEGGEEFDDSDERLVGTLGEWGAIAIQNASLYERAEEQRIELGRTVRALEASGEIARAVAVSNFEGLTDLIAKRARDLIDAVATVVLLPNDGEMIVAATAGATSAAAVGHRLPMDEPWTAQALRSSRALRFGRGELGELQLDRLGIIATWFLFAPVVFHDTGRGLLIALDPIDGNEFTAADERLLTSFASNAAPIVTAARSLATEKLQLSMEASEQERRRWARELHDETLQELGNLRLLHETAGQSKSWEQARDVMARAAKHLHSATRNLQEMITELRPASLDELGIGPAIDALVEEFSQRYGVEIKPEVDLPLAGNPDRERLSPELELAIYRLVQQGLHNAVQHAEPNRIELRAVEEGEAITVRIRDDGRGFDPDSVEEGLGLVGLRERVSLGKGSIRIESAPGAGTTIEAELPTIRPSFSPARARTRSERAPRD